MESGPEGWVVVDIFGDEWRLRAVRPDEEPPPGPVNGSARLTFGETRWRRSLLGDEQSRALARALDVDVDALDGRLVVQALERGILAFEPSAESRWFVPDPSDLAPPSLPPGLDEVGHFVAFELRDLDGNPVPSRPYLVTRPDGSERRGTLDENGQARVDGIDPGKCVIVFPDFDETDHAGLDPLDGAREPGVEGPVVAPDEEAPDAPPDPPEPPAPPEPPEPPLDLTSVAFTIVDASGKPMAGQAYHLALADGSSRDGAVDAEGFAREESLPPGPVQLSLPGVPDDEWDVGQGA